MFNPNTPPGVAVALGSQVLVLANDNQAASPFTVALTLDASGPVLALAGTDLNGDGSTDVLGLVGDRLLGWTNIAGAYAVSATGPSVGGYDIGVHVPGSEGGVITGSVFNDRDGDGNWVPTDPGWYLGVEVYLDLNHDGKLDAGDPVQRPSITGAFQFSGLAPGTYDVRLALNVGGFGKELVQTFPANGAASTAVIADTFGAAFHGADFGVKVAAVSYDFNNDGWADLLYTDPATDAVYVQLRQGDRRLGVVQLGTLPGPTWRVAGVGDWVGNGWQDVLLTDDATGALRLWDVIGGDGRPRVERAIDLPVSVPAGWRVAAVADWDGNGTPDLILQQGASGPLALWLFDGPQVVARKPLRANIRGSLEAAADLYGDGRLELLSRSDGALYVTPPGGQAKRLGTVPDSWAFAAALDLAGTGAAQLLFEDGTDGAYYALAPDGSGHLGAAAALDIGASEGERPLLLFAPRAVTVTVSRIPDQTIAEGTATRALALTVGPPNATAVRVTATSSDPVLIPPGGLVVRGGGSDWTITVRPAAHHRGTATVTLVVTAEGQAPATETFAVTVKPVAYPPTARRDLFAVRAGARAVAVDVLRNDSAGPGAGPLVVTAVTRGSAGGVI